MRSRFLTTAFVGALALSRPAHALVFNFNPAVGTSPQAIAGFSAGGARWSSLFTDAMTVNIDIAFSPLGPGILGQAGSTESNYAYNSVFAALGADASSADDTMAVGSLPAGSVPWYINRTSNNPNGAGSATPYVDNDGDANNTSLFISNANAKAMGLLPGNQAGSDASISFSSSFSWDFDPSDGINPGAFDFVGVATHEIGHAMGFISGVDYLDWYSPSNSPPYPDNAFSVASTMDLFRFSAASTGLGVRDWTADTRVKYFSINGGATVLGQFSQGTLHGDGSQASHWKDSLGIGIMDPTAAPGELLSISALDIRLMDVIGYNLAPVPEPTSLALLLLGGLAVRRRRRAL